MVEKWMFLLFILLICGCSKNPQEVNIYSIPDEFRIDLHQAVSDEGSFPAFRISTIDSRTCTNDNIIVNIDNTGVIFNININDINKAGECNDLSGRLWIDVNAILQPGFYSCSITLKDQVTNNGSIIVTDKGYSFSLTTDYGIEIGKDEILKIPDGLIWGYSIKHEGISPVENGILNHLTPYVNTLPVMQAGDYGLFEIHNDYSYIVYSNPGKVTDSQFLMKLESSVSNIRAVVDQYKKENPEADFKIFTSRGVIN